MKRASALAAPVIVFLVCAFGCGDGKTGSGGTTSSSYSVGGNPDSVVVADLDGDGEPDLVTANVYGNDVSVLLNTCMP